MHIFTKEWAVERIERSENVLIQIHVSRFYPSTFTIKLILNNKVGVERCKMESARQ